MTSNADKGKKKFASGTNYDDYHKTNFFCQTRKYIMLWKDVIPSHVILMQKSFVSKILTYHQAYSYEKDNTYPFYTTRNRFNKRWNFLSIDDYCLSKRIFLIWYTSDYFNITLSFCFYSVEDSLITL